MITTELPTKRLVDALTRRDFDALEESLAPNVRVRLLLPRRVEEIESAGAARTRIEGWFGAATEFDVLSAGDEEIGHRHRLHWRFRLTREAGPEIIEQVAFADTGDDGVQRIDLVCSGFLAEA